ncbi:MAG: ATP-binding protein [Candidatus Promineifilaceae bacterium]
MLLIIVSHRFLQGLLPVTTNLTFANWAETCGNALRFGRSLDHLTRRSHIVQFSGDSYRFRRSLERQWELPQAAI